MSNTAACGPETGPRLPLPDGKRIARLEIAVERLCEMMQRNTRAFPNHWTELELIKQFATGKLDTKI